MRKRLLALASTLLLPAVPASASVITFNGLQTESAFTTYTESGFNVSPTLVSSGLALVARRSFKRS